LLVDRIPDRHAVAVGAVDLLAAEAVGLDHLAGDVFGHTVAIGQTGRWPLWRVTCDEWRESEGQETKRRETKRRRAGVQRRQVAAATKPETGGGSGSTQFGMVVAEPSFHVLAERRGEGDEFAGFIDADAADGIVFGGVALAAAGVEIIGIVPASGSEDEGQGLQGVIVGHGLCDEWLVTSDEREQKLRRREKLPEEN